MGESGDKIPSFLERENALVLKLLKISEDAQKQDVFKKSECGLCGWQPLTSWEREDNQETGSEKVQTTKNAAGKENVTKAWKSAYSREEYNPYKDVETHPRRSKKCTKFHSKRLEELSAPRKVRNKVEMTNCRKTLIPFNDNDPLKEVTFICDKFVKKVALQYAQAPEQEKGVMYQAYPSLRAEISRSATERNFVERSIHDLISSKSLSHSARSQKSAKNLKKHDILLAKTRANVGSDWEMLPVATDIVPDTFSESSIQNERLDQAVDLPLPQVKISTRAVDKRTETLLPPIYPKKKRALGSVTAITQGNLKAGIKSHSISQIKRQAMPQTRVILPRLSGSKVEVPLLPRSPDFLHRIL